MLVAQVAAEGAAGRVFDYEVPSALAGRVGVGATVLAPLGRRTVSGVVLSLADRSAHGGPLRPLLGPAPGAPALPPSLVELARWMASYYLAPVERCIRTMLPPAVRAGAGGDDGFERRLVVRAVGVDDGRTVERSHGHTAEPSDQATIRPSDQATTEPAQATFDFSRKRKAAPAAARAPRAEPTARQREILERLAGGEESLAGFCRTWRVAPETIRRMEADGLVAIEERVVRRDPLAGRRILPTKPLPLTPEQTEALAKIRAALDAPADGPAPKPVLLRGVTASGKTEVYLQAIAAALDKGRGAIVLVPEIALTPQTIQRFVGRFGGIVAVLHSRLSDGERHDEWHRILAGEARVAIGPRSALFAPVKDLGLVVVDEEHEPSYKQDEAPRYHARDVAVMRARIERCAVVLGSATPSLESRRNADEGKYVLATMARRASGEARLPRVAVVDMRGEVAKNGGKLPVFSETLATAIRDRLDNGEQTMLFLNRRGYAPTVQCPSCGHAETCTECSVGMTYHVDDGVLRCHVCGAWRPVPETCPSCGAPGYRYSGIGTQRVEAIARKMFPSARIERMDLDVTTRKASHEEILARFRAGRTDVLVGTQMIAKGLDFPNVTLAGVLNADSGLSLPDFRAGERTFQLIAQMAGRAGRGAKPGDVIVQTLSPDHPAIVHARTEDYEGFAAEELAERRELGYPPFSHFDVATFRGRDRDAVAAYAERFAAAIGKSDEYVLGDACPAPIEKAKGVWRFQVALRGPRPALLNERLRAAAAALPPPGDVGLAIDVDAVGLL